MYQLKCVMCHSHFLSPIRRDTCSPRCANTLFEITAARVANRVDAFCVSCKCLSSQCMNNIGHAMYWSYDTHTHPIPVKPAPTPPPVQVHVQCSKEHVDQKPQQEAINEQIMAAMKQLGDKIKEDLPKVKETEKAVMEIKKIIPKESGALVGLGLAAGIIIKAYFLWTFAAGAAAAYAYKVWSDKQGK